MPNKMTDEEIKLTSIALVFIRKHRTYFEAQKMSEQELVAAAGGWRLAAGQDT
jgi:hypothetical protein